MEMEIAMMDRSQRPAGHCDVLKWLYWDRHPLSGHLRANMPASLICVGGPEHP